MAIEIVDFPINSMVDLSIAMLVHQRVLGNSQIWKSRKTSSFIWGWFPESNSHHSRVRSQGSIISTLIQIYTKRYSNKLAISSYNYLL